MRIKNLPIILRFFGEFYFSYSPRCTVGSRQTPDVFVVSWKFFARVIIHEERTLGSCCFDGVFKVVHTEVLVILSLFSKVKECVRVLMDEEWRNGGHEMVVLVLRVISL